MSDNRAAGECIYCYGDTKHNIYNDVNLNITSIFVKVVKQDV